MMRRYIICYDIVNDKRRDVFSDCLQSYGDRVQYSVFEALLSPSLFSQLKSKILEIIDTEEDKVLIYPLCEKCDIKLLRLGHSDTRHPPGKELVYIA